MIALLSYLFLALFVSFLCSIMESVLLSTPQPYLIAQSEKEYKWAKMFFRFKNDIDRPLSAILSLNTVAHTIGAAGVGAEAVKIFGEASFGVVSAILTIMILVFTEVIPKTVGARYWRGLSKITAYTIQVMIWVTYPLVVMASLITRLFEKKENEISTSREEISALTSIGAEEGLLNENEHKIIQNILRLKNVKVTDIMTPRIVAVTTDENTTLEEFNVKKDEYKFTRIPVYSENIENVTGYILRQRAFELIAEGEVTTKLKDIKREIIVVPEVNELFSVWEKLLEKKEHIALIVDEYGGMAGIVTMEDIIETILGLEIVDEKDTVTDMQKYARQRWLIRRRKNLK